MIDEPPQPDERRILRDRVEMRRDRRVDSRPRLVRRLGVHLPQVSADPAIASHSQVGVHADQLILFRLSAEPGGRVERGQFDKEVYRFFEFTKRLKSDGHQPIKLGTLRRPVDQLVQFQGKLAVGLKIIPQGREQRPHQGGADGIILGIQTESAAEDGHGLIVLPLGQQ